MISSVYQQKKIHLLPMAALFTVSHDHLILERKQMEHVFLKAEVYIPFLFLVILQ